MKRDWGRMTSGAFAALCGTTKETLRHYKDIGLLSPARQGDNGYFYYDAEQFYDFFAISIFRRTGTPLEEVRRCLLGQDAAWTLAQLLEQRVRLGAERRRLEKMDFMLSGMIRGLELGKVPDMIPRVLWFEREHLLALPAAELERELDPAAGENVLLITILERCQELCRRYGLCSNYQLGAIHSPGRDAAPATISHLYTQIQEKADFPHYREKPAGNYLCLCCRGRWDVSEGYGLLTRHIEKEEIRTEGSVYACDLAGFILNSVEENAATLFSIRLADRSKPGGTG